LREGPKIVMGKGLDPQRTITKADQEPGKSIKDSPTEKGTRGGGTFEDGDDHG